MLNIPPTSSTQDILTQVDTFNRTAGYPHGQSRIARQATTEQYLRTVEDAMRDPHSQDPNERWQPTEQGTIDGRTSQSER